MNRYEIYSKRLIWSGAFLLTAFMAGCGGGGGGGSPSPGPGPNPPPQAGPAHYDLGRAASFGAGSGGGVHNTGTLTVVTGDLGTTAASSTITGFHDSTGASYGAAPDGAVSGTIFTLTAPAADAGATGVAVAAALDAAFTAWSPAVAAGGTEPNPAALGQLGGMTLAPGVYRSAGLQITGADLTLDAQGNPDAFWILQSDSTLTVGDTAPRSVVLANGAVAKNVYWHVPGSVIINAAGGGTMTGSIITKNTLDISSAAATVPTTLNGRAFIFAGLPINMFNTVINTPAQP